MCITVVNFFFVAHDQKNTGTNTKYTTYTHTNFEQVPGAIFKYITLVKNTQQKTSVVYINV